MSDSDNSDGSDSGYQDIRDGEIIFHFDVVDHSLPLKQFVETAKATKEILDCLNEEVFGKNCKFEVYIIPSEEGGFVQVLLVFGALLLGTAELLDTGIGKGSFKALMGHEPYEWAECKVGEYKRKYIDKLDFIQAVDEDSYLKRPEDAQKEDLSAYSKLLAGMTSGFIRKPVEDLEDGGFDRTKFRKAYEGKNLIYEQCKNNKEVKGLGFDRSDKFPVSRDQFSKHIAYLQKDKVYQKPEIVEVHLNSPNRLEKGRAWQGEVEGETISFKINDPDFWDIVNEEKFIPTTQGKIRVQISFPAKKSTGLKPMVWRVLSTDNKCIADPMNDEELDERVAELNKMGKTVYELEGYTTEDRATTPHQPDFFEK